MRVAAVTLKLEISAVADIRVQYLSWNLHFLMRVMTLQLPQTVIAQEVKQAKCLSCFSKVFLKKISNGNYILNVLSFENIFSGSKLCSSFQAQEINNSLSFTEKFHPLEADIELSDSASSTSTATMARKHATTTLIMFDRAKATARELDYVKEILCNVDLMFKDFALGRSRDIINPHLFNLLETRKRPLESDVCETRLRRKVLFDCVSECLDLRCKLCVAGGYRMWGKGVAMVRRKERLAEEVYKEISGWENMADSMVDELVDKDMSSQFGKWLDFEVDEFSLGVEVEAQIFDSLIDELVDDMFRF